MHKQLTFIEHVSKRAFYGGSSIVSEHDTWVWNESWTSAKLIYSDALINNFNEIRVNAIDHYYRSAIEPMSTGGPVTDIKIAFNNGEISIWNNGPGIPVIKSWPGQTRECYLPQALISEERSGSNFNDKEDPDRVTGGLNGLGVKVTNIGSTVFTLETLDIVNGYSYKQTCRNNLRVVEPPIVKKVSGIRKAFTRFIWMPDYDNLCKISKTKPSVGWLAKNTNTVENILRLMAYQTAVFTSTIRYRYKGNKLINHKPPRVFFNNKLVRVDLQGFVKLFGAQNTVVLTLEGRNIRFPWYICLAKAENTGGASMSIVNGTHARLGGSHVNLMTRAIIAGLERRLKSKISEHVFNSVFCYFDCKQFPVTVIDFDSQTKNKVGIGRTEYLALQRKFTLSATQIKAIHALAGDSIEAILTREEYKRSTKKKVIKIQKYEKAEKAGTRESHKCGLFIPEGDTAGITVRNIIKSKHTPIDKRYYGMYSIQGVPPNALKMVKWIGEQGKLRPLASRQLQNNTALQGLALALNLDYTHSYSMTEEGNKQFRKLHYGHIVMATDQDLDGIGHICSLVLVFLLTFWPSLIKRGFFKRFATPVIRVYKVRNVWNFYSQAEYEAWVVKRFGSKTPAAGYETKYYKGLGGHTPEEVIDMGSKFHDNVFTITWDVDAFNNMKTMYGEDSSARKQILGTPTSVKYPNNTWKTRKIAVSTHLQIETKEFQLHNMRRKIKSCIDGMIPSQRKALCGARKMFTNNKQTAKVYQVSGYITKQMHYAHGDASMNGVIMKMAQSFIGANNIPHFVPISNGFGDRVSGRSKNSGPRYLDTKYNRVMDLIFPPQDDCLLNYKYDDGVKCEPIHYVPIVPMAILETETTTGTGWKISVWARSWDYTVANVRRAIIGAEPLNFAGRVWLRSGGLKCKLVDRLEICCGSYTLGEDFLTVTELPLRVWSEPYTRTMERKKYVTKVKDDTSNYENEIKIWLEPGALDKIKANHGNKYLDSVQDYFKIYKNMTPCLNLLDETGYILEFETYREIFNYWFPVRRDLYIERKSRMAMLLDYKITYYKNILRFILSEKKINIDLEFTDAQRVEILERSDFTKINKTALLNPSLTRTCELRDAIFGISANYGYIFDITVREKSKECIEKLQQKISDLEFEVAKVEMSSWQEIWLEELDNLESVVKKGLATNWTFSTVKRKFKTVIV